MARQRRADPEAALDAAVALFWRDGYRDTGTRRIEEETGITRFSLQTDYGGKHGLFLSAIDRYLDLFEAMGAPPARPESVGALADWFGSAKGDPDMVALSANGCLLMASLTELDAPAEDLAPRARRFFDLMRGRLGSALRHLVGTGALRADLDIETGAETLLAMAVSMNLQRRAARSREASRPVKRAAAALLADWAAGAGAKTA